MKFNPNVLFDKNTSREFYVILIYMMNTFCVSIAKMILVGSACIHPL